jgi:hypothetical protein
VFLPAPPDGALVRTNIVQGTIGDGGDTNDKFGGTAGFSASERERVRILSTCTTASRFRDLNAHLTGPYGPVSVVPVG